MLGRNRLFDAFLGYELWPEMLGLAESFYLEPTELPEEQARRFYALALANFARGETNAAHILMVSIDGCRKQLKQERYEAAERAEEAAKKDKKDTTEPMVKAMKGFNSRLDRVDKYRDELAIWWSLAEGKTNETRKLLDDSAGLPVEQRARIWQSLGDRTNTVKLAREIADSSTNQAPDLALAAALLWQARKTNAAIKSFKQLRAISSRFDLETPVFARLSPIAQNLGLPLDWRIPPPKKKDTGKRPSLDSLGPFRWEPYTAPAWTLTDAAGHQRSLADYRGRPVLMVFYLGAGCQHCVEQLNLLATDGKDFEALGISVIAVSTERPAALSRSANKSDSEKCERVERTREQRASSPQPSPPEEERERTSQARSKVKSGELRFPILSDKSLKTFKAYRAYDDFEQMPLHGTFLVDGNGKVRWQDISYDPFTELKFLAAESRRLLGMGKSDFAASINRVKLEQ